MFRSSLRPPLVLLLALATFTATARMAAPSGHPAPGYPGITRWINSPPLTLPSLRGKVVLVDFWTFDCINCLHALPQVKALDARYRNQGLVVIGVHTPELRAERDTGNLRAAVQRLGITYPGGAGQRLRHLERLTQPALAGPVRDRRAGPGGL